MNNAFKWLAEILGSGANMNQPVQYLVGIYEVINADVQSVSFLDGKNNQNPNFLREIIQHGKTVQTFSDLTNDEEFNKLDKGEVAFGYIRIGENIGLNESDGNFDWTNHDYYAYLPQRPDRGAKICGNSGTLS